MGNQPPVGARNNGPFRRPNGALGLSRSELDDRCKPSGLYQDCAWDERTIRRLIGDGKLAARQTGKECRENGIEQECPICFLYYDDINMLKCCKATICTECYLQLQNPSAEGNHHHHHHNPNSSSPCPFCAKPDMEVEKAKRLDVQDVLERDAEEQRVIEATIRARANSESKSLRSEKSDGDSSTGGVEKDFGSRLNEELKRFRKSSTRTISFDSTGTGAGENDSINIDTIAMTVEERRELENRMKSQLSHPLMREMQRNAEIESQRHLLEHAERRRDQVRNSRDSLERFIERARIREHGLNLFSGSGGRGMGRNEDEDGDGRPDDLYLLEAALFLSAREDSLRRRREGRSRSGGGEGGGGRNRNRESALFQALMAGPRGDRGMDELLNARYERRRNDTDDRDNNRDDGRNESEDRGNNNRLGLTPADILLAGVSEASQIEMAIQMSLREAEQQQQQQQNQQDGVENDDAGRTENGNEQNTAEDVQTTEN